MHWRRRSRHCRWGQGNWLDRRWWELSCVLRYRRPILLDGAGLQLIDNVLGNLRNELWINRGLRLIKCRCDSLVDGLLWPKITGCIRHSVFASHARRPSRTSFGLIVEVTMVDRVSHARGCEVGIPRFISHCRSQGLHQGLGFEHYAIRAAACPECTSCDLMMLIDRLHAVGRQRMSGFP